MHLFAEAVGPRLKPSCGYHVTVCRPFVFVGAAGRTPLRQSLTRLRCSRPCELCPAQCRWAVGLVCMRKSDHERQKHERRSLAIQKTLAASSPQKWTFRILSSRRRQPSSRHLALRLKGIPKFSCQFGRQRPKYSIMDDGRIPVAVRLCLKSPTANSVLESESRFVDVERDCTVSPLWKKALEKTILRTLNHARFHTDWVRSRHSRIEDS